MTMSPFLFVALFLLATPGDVSSFTATGLTRHRQQALLHSTTRIGSRYCSPFIPRQQQQQPQQPTHQSCSFSPSSLFALAADEEQDKKIRAGVPEEKPLILESNYDDNNNNNANDSRNENDAKAVTGSINERLMAELQQAADKEKYGAKSGAGKKFSLAGLRGPRKSPDEIQASLAEARDLNGVNPTVCLLGGLFAFGVAAGLWYATNSLAAFFALHPVETDLYFVQRLAAVFRNVIMGLISLASGFFGVTGMGIFLLGVRVAIGVAKGELDPTPIQKKSVDDELQMPNVWDLMMNKKPTRRGGRGRNDNNNPFGL